MNILLFICITGDYIVCQEPIKVIFDTDWYAFWLGIGFTALITAGAVIVGMLLNNWNDKRVTKDKAKTSLKNELTDIVDILNNPSSKNNGTAFNGDSFSFTPYRFETVSYQSIVHSGSLLIIDGDLQGDIRNSYALILEHNNLLAEIEKLLPNVFLHKVFNYKEYMGHIEHLQVSLTGLESEMKKQFELVLSRL